MTSARDRVFFGGIAGRELGAPVCACRAELGRAVWLCVLRCLLFAYLRIPVTFRLSAAVLYAKTVVMAASFGVSAGK